MLKMLTKKNRIQGNKEKVRIQSSCSSATKVKAKVDTHGSTVIQIISKKMLFGLWKKEEYLWLFKYENSLYEKS